jgi:hypothetical protein
MGRLSIPAKVIAIFVVVVVWMGIAYWHTSRFPGVVGGAIVMAAIVAIWLWNRRGNHA